MSLSRTVYVGGHVSLGFAPRFTPEGEPSGSIGFGACLTVGAGATSGPGEPGFTITGIPDPQVTRAAWDELATARLVQVTRRHITTRLDLPPGCGFGMSAAGTLATLLAAHQGDEVPEERVWHAAHRAEIAKGGGLGDVVAIRAGGWAIRATAGPPGIAEVTGTPDTGAWLVATNGETWSTKGLLARPELQARLAHVTSDWDAGLPHSVEAILAEGRVFSTALGLHPRPLLDLCEELEDAAPVHLGPSLICRDTPENHLRLRGWRLFRVGIAPVRKVG